MTDREFATDVVRRLRETGFEALWAGGCVRDELLGQTPEDYDVATSARPEQVRGVFRRTIEVGASFGVVEVIGPRLGDKHLTVQVATFRSDGSYSDGRRPDAVTYCTAREDALRRDFTINGMFFDPLAEQLIDFVGGRADLQAKVVRAIGDPLARFTEDKLRLLRAVRFATRFGMTIDSATLTAIRTMAGQIAVVSAERIADELRKLLTDPRRLRGLHLLAETGLLTALLPEVAQLQRVPYGTTSDRWQYVQAVVDRLPANAGFHLVFAALLHAIGIGESDPADAAAPVIAAQIATRLRLANTERACITWLVEKQRHLTTAAALRTSALKTILANVHIKDLLELHRAIALASGAALDGVNFAERMLHEWADKNELTPAPLITGDDLTRLGLTPGPQFKSYLDAVRTAQLDGTISTHDQALALIHQLRST